MPGKWKFSTFYIWSYLETELLDGIEMHYFASICIIYFPQKTLFILRKVEYNTAVQTNDHLYAIEQKMYKDFRHAIKIQKKNNLKKR